MHNEKSMSEELEAFEEIKNFAYSNDWDELIYLRDRKKKELDIIETALKDREKILARLQSVQMTINTLLKEYSDSIKYFEEEDYMFTVYCIRSEVLSQISNLLEDVLK